VLLGQIKTHFKDLRIDQIDEQYKIYIYIFMSRALKGLPIYAFKIDSSHFRLPKVYLIDLQLYDGQHGHF
jgi:hypothetical protein